LAKASIATIGFTQTSAERFFDRLLSAGVKKVVDVRLHNTSQLAGFAKADDLAYFLNRIGGIAYVHEPLLAPTDAMFKVYKKDKGEWAAYETRASQAGVARRSVSPVLRGEAASLPPSARV
jgi:uncharacterized protein (DUF488 family)